MKNRFPKTHFAETGFRNPGSAKPHPLPPITPRLSTSHPSAPRRSTACPPNPRLTNPRPTNPRLPRIRQFLLFFAMIGLLAAGTSLCACTGTGTAELWKTGFRTEIEGTLSDVPFTALVCGKLRADGTPEASVQYLSVGTVNSGTANSAPSESGIPKSGTSESAGQAKNSGILLSRNPDGTVTVTRNDRTARISEEAASDLLAPLDCLLHAAGAPIAAEQKPDGGTTLVYPDGTRLTLSPNGIPESGETETLHFRVVWWEPSA